MSTDVIADALRPWVGGGFLDYTAQPSWAPDAGWHNYKVWARTPIYGGVGAIDAFNPAEALYLLRAYNETYNLGLTDAEIAAGINKFGQWHQNRFNSKLVADSSSVAVAAQSLAEALSLKGQDGYGSVFWQDIAKPGGDLERGAKEAVARGEAAVAEIKKRTDTAQAVFGSGLFTQIPYSNGGDSFGDFLMDVAPIVMAGVVGASALGWGGLAGAAETGASLGSGISAGAGGVTGISAGAGGVTGVTGSVAGLGGGVLAPAATGGFLVGSNGLIGSTGNAIGDAVLNNSIQSGLTSAVSGGDPLEGALRGAAGGLISSSGVLNDVSAALTPSDAGQVATNAISRGVNAAGTNLLTTGDVGTAAEAGLISGIGNYVGGTVAETGAPPVVAGAAGGGAAGATGAALNGGDIANGLITGAAGGGASGLASQLGANSGVASGIGSIVGGVVGSELADDQTAAGPTPVGTPAPTPTPFAGMTFADMLPPEFVDVMRTTDWGSRLTNARSMT